MIFVLDEMDGPLIEAIQVAGFKYGKFSVTQAGLVKPALFPPGYIGRAERRRRERMARKQKGNR